MLMFTSNKTKTLALWKIAAICLIFNTQAGIAQSFTFTKIVDSSTEIPGTDGETFSSFAGPTLRFDNIAFEARDASSKRGIYTYINGTLAFVADDDTITPGDTTPFRAVRDPAFDGFKVVFEAQPFNPDTQLNLQGIYANFDDPLSALAQAGDLIPGEGMGTIGNVGAPSLDFRNVTFISLNTDDAILKVSGGVLSVIAGINTIVPGTGIPGQVFGGSRFGSFPAISGQNVVFGGATKFASTDGVYISVNGLISVVADQLNLPPGAPNAILNDRMGISGTNVVFIVENPISQRGVFTKIGNTVSAVATDLAQIPGTADTFKSFLNPSISGEKVAFLARGKQDTSSVVYTNLGGALQKVLGVGDVLDGSTVNGLNIKSAGAISGNKIVMTVSLANGLQTIYVAGVFVDGDDDGIGDGVDNCPADPNPLQEDPDGDNRGSICDDCPSDATDSCEVSGSGAVEISVDSGGRLTTPSGNLSIDVPAGSVEQDTTISATQLDKPAGDLELLLGSGTGKGRAVALFDLAPDGQTFDPAATLTVMIDVTSLNDNQISKLDLYRENEQGKFEALGATCNSNEPPAPIISTCSVLIDHFSNYLLITPADTDGDGVADEFGDESDNCPDIANPDQADADDNELGNLCDPEYIFGSGFESPGT